jgi:hypothetical protein
VELVKKLLILIAALALTGCMSVIQRPPPAVLAMPNDCANRQALINWLETQSSIPRQAFESEKHYEHTRSQIRHRLWHVRYNCQPV